MTKFYLFVIKSGESGAGLIQAKSLAFPLSTPFGISRGVKTQAEVIEVSITKDGKIGMGEAVPYARYGESVAGCLEQISGLPKEFDREQLMNLLPAGAARNAVDLALWDLEAKLQARPVWSLAGLPEPRPLPFGYTVSLASVAEMAAAAEKNSTVEFLKVKLGGDNDAEALRAIRAAAPESRLLVDVNEGWTLEQLTQLVPVLRECEVELLEQPLAASDNELLASADVGIPICADESNQGGRSLIELAKNCQVVNIKLDKSGGLTAALAEIELARSVGLKVMVGCMVSSSLAIAPAYLLGQLADYSDLDGFASLAQDRTNQMQISNGRVSAPEALWGYPN